MTPCKHTIKHLGCIWLCVLFFTVAGVAWPQAAPDFSGLWKQDGGSCQPKRSGDVTLKIEHHGSRVEINTSILHASESPRHADQVYTTDGVVSISKGADGDEFHTAVVWKQSSLIFSIEEHEDGRILDSKETWSLLEGQATLERIRERADGQKQVLIYRRQKPAQTNP